jgi:hypothetical protein
MKSPPLPNLVAPPLLSCSSRCFLPGRRHPLLLSLPLTLSHPLSFLAPPRAPALHYRARQAPGAADHARPTRPRPCELKHRAATRCRAAPRSPTPRARDTDRSSHAPAMSCAPRSRRTMPRRPKHRARPTEPPAPRTRPSARSCRDPVCIRASRPTAPYPDLALVLRTSSPVQSTGRPSRLFFIASKEDLLRPFSLPPLLFMKKPMAIHGRDLCSPSLFLYKIPAEPFFLPTPSSPPLSPSLALAGTSPESTPPRRRSAHAHPLSKPCPRAVAPPLAIVKFVAGPSAPICRSTELRSCLRVVRRSPFVPESVKLAHAAPRQPCPRRSPSSVHPRLKRTKTI